MDLNIANRYAAKLVEWLQPFCGRIEIVGSIRRGRPVVNDVDIVCIPIVTEKKDLLGEVIGRQNHALHHLQMHAMGGKAKILSGGEREGKQVMVELSKCQLDLWFATAETFATRMLCRTGSKEHNIWLAQRAQDRGGHWNPYEGLKLHGKLVKAEIEEDIYRALSVPWIEPKNREIDWITRNVK
jgi:DNA polymerase/3'-5' exonuclease PolX